MVTKKKSSKKTSTSKKAPVAKKAPVLKKVTHFEKEITLQEALILSMTVAERNNPDILNSSRKHRIAKGAGSNIQEVNRLLKKYKQMQKMLKKFGKIDQNQVKKMMDAKDLDSFKGMM